MDRFENLIREVERMLKDDELIHSRNVRRVVEFLKPGADQSLLIAAEAHDIGDSIYNESHTDDEEMRVERARRDSEIVARIMKRHNYSNDEIERTKWLIANHEYKKLKDDEDLKVLKIADWYDTGARKVFEKLERDKAEVISKEILKNIPEDILGNIRKSVKFYSNTQKTTKCIFCEIASGESPCHKIWEDGKHLAFLSIFPNTEGFSVVITKKHYSSYAFDLPDGVLKDLVIASKKVAKLLDEKLEDVGRTGLIFEGTEWITYTRNFFQCTGQKWTGGRN